MKIDTEFSNQFTYRERAYIYDDAAVCDLSGSITVGCSVRIILWIMWLHVSWS